MKNYANVEIITGAFEEVELSPNTFDLIYAATAFHWIKPEVRFTKTFNLLKQNGYLAVIHTNHVSDGLGDEFFFASQPLYRKYDLIGKDENFRLPRIADLGPAGLDENLFDLTFFKAFPLVVRYSADRYAGLVGTFSPVLSMDPEMRVEFLKELSLLIEKQFGGSLQKHFAMTLTIARKKT